MLSSPLPTTVADEGDNDALLRFCKAAADGLRLQILRVLSQDTYTVQELCSIFAIRQSGMSHHLKILATAGLVTKRREGNSLFYRRSVAPPGALAELHSALMSNVDDIALDSDTETRLATVFKERAASSSAFFADNADQFRQHQEQMVDFDVYGTSTAELLASQQPRGGELAIEIGPGEGAFLAPLAARYRRVIALDNAESMLGRARTFIEAQGLANVEALLGDSSSPQLPEGQADCVVANMVLHHVPSPGDIFADVWRLLRGGGIFCVTELCHHDQSWAREACGDIWLGFEPDDLSQWAQSAGFEEGPAAYLAQLNGFRVQVRQFVKPGSNT
ncbi:metalloregulator ArsR/SmtB family transcription factor [Spongiibacter taiwanensis]|uniref:ArsR/SmtB family transcription factor n=1 Tax=Spongiibacter taiwanensis TaxID=1748242 RepID=UPI002034F57B|nr:metalloregulator ArsR/SmtB family transcription factor [Spongiibacter taiwanensis]USA42069.1 metalloregulator ArsR/SmtB family transcription factor [Spongiibacter taiwanensis]